MSAATFTGAVADLYARITRAPAGVTKTYDHQPRLGDLARPVSLYVTPAGMTPTEWRIAVRLWVDASDDVAAAQATLANLMPAVDALLTSAPRSAWTVQPLFSGDQNEPSVWLGETVVEVGREDF